MYLLLVTRKGISSLQLSKEIGITQKSAWLVLQRLHEACGDDLSVLQNIAKIAKHDMTLPAEGIDCYE